MSEQRVFKRLRLNCQSMFIKWLRLQSNTDNFLYRYLMVNRRYLNFPFNDPSTTIVMSTENFELKLVFEWIYYVPIGRKCLKLLFTRDSTHTLVQLIDSHRIKFAVDEMLMLDQDFEEQIVKWTHLCLDIKRESSQRFYTF